MVNKYYVKDNFDSDYLIIENINNRVTTYELYSGSDGWIRKNELLGRIVDNGNGFKIKMTDHINFNATTYHDAEYLRLFLSFINQKQDYPSEYTILKEDFKIK